MLSEAGSVYTCVDLPAAETNKTSSQSCTCSPVVFFLALTKLGQMNTNL